MDSHSSKNIRIYILTILMFSFCFLFSQEKNEFNKFQIHLKEKANQYNSNIYFKKSVSFFLQKEWDSTLIYTTKCLNTLDNITEMSNYCHYFRGYSFKHKKNFNEAEDEFNLVSPQSMIYFIAKKRLGEISLEKKEFKKAILHLELLTKLGKEEYAYFSKSSILQNLGLCYHHLGEFKKAEPYLLSSLKLHESKRDTIGLITAYVNIANLYYEQYKDDLAIPYFEIAYGLSKSVEDFDIRETNSLNMAVVEENRKNFKKALVYRKEYEKWKDSLNDQNKIYEVAKLEKAFAVKQKQQEVNFLEAENKAKVKERNGLFYSLITLLILLGITFYFYKEKIKTNKIILSQKERLNELNTAKDKLFSIVSHDLRSSVNALKSSNNKLLDNLESKNLDALESTLQNNSGIVNGAYNLLDNLLHWALLQTKQSYFHIEEIRLFFIVEQVAYNYKPLLKDKELNFENLVPKIDKVFADQESLKIVLRNLFDNAIKFSNPKDSITVYTENTNDGYCNLIVEDSGLGMEQSTLKAILKDSDALPKRQHKDKIGTGLGLQLCKNYIAKNNGEFSIESELGKGTKMIVSLPKTASNG